MTLLIFATEYFCLSMWTYGLAVPGGIFIPLLLTGAAWGRLIGLGVESVFPNVAGIDPGKYALVGAAAQLGGVVRMTISLTAIIMEATKDITFVMPIMITLWAAKFVGDYFNEVRVTILIIYIFRVFMTVTLNNWRSLFLVGIHRNFPEIF